MENVKKLSAFDKRIHEIDFVRGLLIILVVMDHIFIQIGNFSSASNWNIPELYNFFTLWYFKGVLREIVQPLVLMLFCFVSGISCAFSKNNWKRAIETIAVALLICVLTHIAQLMSDNNLLSFIGNPYTIIDFNIIGVLGVCMLIYCFIQKRSYKAIAVVILISFLLSWYFIPTLRENLCNTHFGYYDATDPALSYRPGGYYKIPRFVIPFFWEPIYGNDATADYVPLFPYIIFFFLGTLFSYFVYKDKRQSIIPHKGNWERPICFLGRHTLIIYFTHILAVFLIFAAINGIVMACR